MYNITTMGKLLAVDLDGTLFFPKNYKRCICHKNIIFLRKWIDAGNKLVLVTSRSIEFVKKLKKWIKRDYDMICCSGSQICANGEIIRDLPMDPKITKEIMYKIAKQYDPAGYICVTNRYQFLLENRRVSTAMLHLYNIYYTFQRAYREPYAVDDEYVMLEEELKEGKIYKVMIFFGVGKKKSVISKEINTELRKNYPEIEASWSSIIIELTSKGADKGTGLEYYCSSQHINADDVYVVGDSGNDIAMFKNFHEHSYCMAHAYTSVRKHARHVIHRVHNLDKLVLKGED